MPDTATNRDDDSNIFYLWAAVAFFVAAAAPLGILIAAPLFQLSTWSNVLVVIKLVGVIFAFGIVGGVITQWLIGRKKPLVHNLVGFVLIMVCLAGSVIMMTFFYDTSLVGRLGKATGMASSFMALASANGLGRYGAAWVQSRRQRKRCETSKG